MDRTTIDSRPHIRFGPRRLTHGTFFVSDLQASTRFYTEICGLNLVFEEPGISAVFLSNGNTHHDIALVETSPAERLGKDGQVQVPRGRGGTPGLNHLGFEMETEQELVRAYQRAVDARLPIHRTADHQVAHSVYLFDPDGNYLEFYADATRDWRGVFERAGNALITGVWNPDLESANPDVRYDRAPNLAARQGSILSARRSARATLNVRDLAEAIAFYQRVVGMTVLHSDDASADLAGTAGHACLRLREAAADRRPGLDSFGFEVSDSQEFEEASRRLDHAGVLRVQDTSPPESILAIRDPDGLKLEFFIRTQN